jgi:hypothetical protein
MTKKIYAMVPAMVLAIGSATALAQPTVSPFAQYDRATLTENGALLRPYDQESAIAFHAAFVGDGTNVAVQQPFQYNFGGAVAHVGDGSSPSYLGNQRAILNEPGYSVGTGAAWIRRA